MEKVVIRGITLVADSEGLEHYARLRIGQQGECHDMFIYPRTDGIVMTDLASSMFMSLGDFEVSETENLVIHFFDPDGTAKFSGVLWYEDGEPEMGVPAGRLVTFKFGGGADLATAYASTGLGSSDNKQNPKCVYYMIGGTVLPEDKLIQGLGLHSSGAGLVGVLPPKGTFWAPSVLLKFDGLETIVLKGQVEAGTKAGIVVYCVEVPKAGKTVEGTDVATLTPFLGAPVPTMTAPDTSMKVSARSFLKRTVRRM